jgi:hypothetical protein
MNGFSLDFLGTEAAMPTNHRRAAVYNNEKTIGKLCIAFFYSGERVSVP